MGGANNCIPPKTESNLPTVSLESILLSLVIDGHERRRYIVFDVSDVYLNTRMSPQKKHYHKVRERIRGYKMGKSFVYEVSQGPVWMYGIILITVQYCYKKLKEIGFILNPYNRCVVNKDIHGGQCTILWYVDEVKISHKNQEVIDNIIRDLQSSFGDLNIQNGNQHTYLGMKIKMNKDSAIDSNMTDFIEGVIGFFPEIIKSGVSSNATRNMFNIRTEQERLPDDKKQICHLIEAKLSLVMKR